MADGFDFSNRNSLLSRIGPAIIQQRIAGQQADEREARRREDQSLRDGLAFLRAGASTKDFEALLLDRGARPSTVQALRGLEPAIKKQRKLDEDIGTQATGLGALLQRTESGAAHPQQLTGALESLQAQFGPEEMGRIASLGQAQFQQSQAQEEAGARRAAIGSQAVEARAEATRVAKEDIKSQDPVVVARRKASEITLRLLEGKGPSPRERAFLNEFQKLDPLKALIQSSLRGALETAGITGGSSRDVETDARSSFDSDPEMVGFVIDSVNPDGTLIVKRKGSQELLDYTPPAGTQ